jgi:methylaspartate ammonia-lyase
MLVGNRPSVVYCQVQQLGLGCGGGCSHIDIVKSASVRVAKAGSTANLCLCVGSTHSKLYVTGCGIFRLLV